MDPIRRWVPLVAILLLGCARQQAPAVALYCAQDREFAEELLRRVEREQGVEVRTKYDTEANKSVSLVQELIHEAGRPRCDLFWNNEILSTIRLHRRGLLRPAAGLGGLGSPTVRAADGSWVAFAARARVLIVQSRVPPADRPRRLRDLLDPRWKGRVAMSRPQFGTSATHAACLFDVMGPAGAKLFYEQLRANEVQLVAGNKQVAEGVGGGRFAVGVTDQDDALQEIAAGRAVEMILPDALPDPENRRNGVLLIPNTLALIAGGPQPDAARRVYERLLDPEVESMLAGGGAYQIPLNPDVAIPLHPALEGIRTAKPMEVNWENAADQWDEVQLFLRAVFGS